MIAAQVRAGSRWCKKKRDSSAVNSGAVAITTSTFATVVIVIATMKAVNITLQHTPDNHRGQPPWRILEKTTRPWKKGRITSSDSTVKKLRQKVTSKLRACSRWRVTTPAMDHMSVAATIRKTARVCVSCIVVLEKRRAPRPAPRS